MRKRKAKSRIKAENSGVAYQNKDIASKLAGEYFKGKSLSAYGLNLPRITGVMPTNLPAIEANELRLDNLFEFEDGSVGIIDYESAYNDPAQKIKYLNYVARVAKRYLRERKPLCKLRLIVIYTADVAERQVRPVYDIGCLRLQTEAAFLSSLDGGAIQEKLRKKILSGEALGEEEMMQFIILPLTKKSPGDKLETLREEIDWAKNMEDEQQGTFLLSALLVFSDKIIDNETSEEVRRWLSMTKVARIFEEEKREALQKLERKKDEEKAQALKAKDEEKAQALKAKDEEKAQALKAKDEERAQALKAKDEEQQAFIRNLMQATALSDDEIAKIADTFSLAEVRDIRRRLAG